MQTQSKIALVTGGSRGLGKDMAIQLAKKGNDVILTYRSKEEDAREVVKQIEEKGQKAICLHLDMEDFSSLDSFVENLGKSLSATWGSPKFDFLINNAGMGATVPFTQVTEALFDSFLNVHFKGVYFLTQKCLPLLNDGGRIINISTGTTRFSNPGYSVYASMKGAVEVFTKYLAKELGVRGITANVLAPGPVETDFNNAFIRSNEQVKSVLGNLSPLGRVGAANDIGGVVAFLCSPEAGWINGQRIEVSGGINT
ncbi:MAG TPA: SDR family oxidoreductase [Catalimonadaceae bacterium]|nr:SDR family oxidoreductase [Catalimonadaceae bacterium]